MINLSNTDRHHIILERLEKDEKIDVMQLVTDLNVSAVTIRKDLKLLEERGLLFRTHGGASKFNPYIRDRTVLEKEKIFTSEKQRIAAVAATLIEPNDSIVLGSGTTIQTLAKNIDTEISLTVITSCLHSANTLYHYSNIDVLQLAGPIRKNSGSVTGQYAESFFEHIICSKLFLGADGIDLQRGLTTSDLAEAQLNRKMIDASEEVIVLADSSKFGKHSFGKIGYFDKVSKIITDSSISDKYLKEFEKAGIVIEIAN